MQLGQSRTLPVEKPEQIDLAQAARYFGARGEADTATMALLQRCAVPLLAAATPRAVWLRAEVKALADLRAYRTPTPLGPWNLCPASDSISQPMSFTFTGI